MRTTDRNHWKAPLVAAVAAMGLIAAGCGDSNDEPTESVETSEAKAEFIAAADAICVDTGDEINAEVAKRLEGTTSSPTNKDLVALFTEVTLPALQGQVDEIEELPRPPGEEEAVQAIIDSGNEAIAESEADPDLLLVPQGEGTPFDEVNQLAQDFGLTVCGGAEPPAGQPAG